MDQLYLNAAAYQSLLDVSYRIILGRKGKLTELKIGFAPVDFHHLVGLHKLIDLRVARASREKVFQRILNGEITYDMVFRSRYFPAIQSRFMLFSNLETLLDQNQLVFRYNANSNQFSLIEADYVLSTPHNNTDVYIFIAQDENTGLYFCRSFFPKGDRDYTEKQPRYTMLYKEKINLSTGETVIQYDHLTPRN